MNKDTILETLDQTKPVAFFDVDGVLVHPYVILHFPKFLAQQTPSLFKIDKLHLMIERVENYRRGEVDYEQFATDWIRTYAAGIAGNEVNTIGLQAEKFWSDNIDVLLYPYARALISLLKPYHTIIAVSGSTTDSLYPLTKLLGIDYLFASTIQIDENHRYIDKEPINRATDKGKEEVVQQVKGIIDNKLWPLGFGFGDNIVHDEPLLRHVGSPYLFADVSSEEKQQKLNKQFAQLQLKVPQVILLRQPQDNPHILSIISKRLSALGLSN